MHPHKLCTALMRKALDSPASHFELHTWTPVLGTPVRTDEGWWRVNTPKGEITARQVVLCTNGHTGNFFDKEDDPMHTQWVVHYAAIAHLQHLPIPRPVRDDYSTAQLLGRAYPAAHVQHTRWALSCDRSDRSAHPRRRAGAAGTRRQGAD